ncbi:MAG: phage integrase SAM-like domain-containing protein [Desulfovibrionaceae bacterium]|nr:phage integrase SAM-like domain-containing protein [Desulfovibrionaceae bacterium]
MQTILMEKDLGAMKAQDGFDKFMRVKRMQKLSPETIFYCDQCFRYFTEYFDASQPCSSITKDIFHGYIEYLDNNGNANTVTTNTYLRGVRALLYYFMEEGYTRQFKVELLKQKKTIKEPYSEAASQGF